MPEFKRYSEVGEVAIENAEGIDSIITELDNIIADLNQKIVNTLHRVVGDISGRSQGVLRGISGGSQGVLTLWSHILETLTKKTRAIVLKSKYVDKILLEGGVLRDYVSLILYFLQLLSFIYKLLSIIFIQSFFQ